MNQRRLFVSVLFAVLFVGVVAQGSLMAKETDSNNLDVTYSERILFADDFSDGETGTLPTGWLANESAEEYGDIQVVVDSNVPSGRALQISTTPYSGSTKKVILRGSLWEGASENDDKIAIQFAIQRNEGSSGVYVYFNKTGSDHRIILLPGQRRLTWHRTGDATNLGPLEDGWNQIRIIADKEDGTADVYVNDMDNPVARSLQFQRPVETWKDMRIMITHETHPEEYREARYTDFKVWIVE